MIDGHGRGGGVLGELQVRGAVRAGEGGEPHEAAGLARYGEVVEQSAEAVKLKVKRDRVIPVCKALLDELPVNDIDIQEVPIEEVIRQIFARQGETPAEPW